MSFEVVESRRLKRVAGVVLIVGLGTVLSGLHLYHLLTSGETVLSLLLGAIVPLALSSLLLVAGFWLARTDYDALSLRIGGWCAVGTALLLGISYITIQYQRSRGITMVHDLSVLASNATGGAIVGLLIGAYDADRKQTERRLTEEREVAEQLSRRLTVLNRVLRHDIRNDVNVIQGNARLIIQGTNTPEVPAKAIRERASKLHRLSESARKMESLLGHEESATEPIDVAALLRSKVHRLERDRPGIESEIDAPDEVWACANPMFDSAIDNVVENAIEHNDADVPRIEASLARSDDTVEIRISDNGPGLPDDEIEILEKGHETDLEHTSGLGLWFVNWLVTESGGEIAFEGGNGEGSVVVLRLPACDPPNTASGSGE